MAATQAILPPLEVRVSDDGLEAHIVTYDEGGVLAAPPGNITLSAFVESNGIPVTDGVRARLDEYLAALTDPVRAAALRQTPYPIAKGKAPVEATDTMIRPPESGPVEPSSLEPIPANTLIGHLVIGRHALAGVSVFGTTISPQRALGRTLRLGDGLRLDETQDDSIFTTRPGLLVREGDSLRVVKVLVTDGDVDIATGSIDSQADVRVKGSIKSGAHVRSQRSIVVEDAIEGGGACSQGELIVGRGIFGAGVHPRIRAGGQARTPICDEVVLLCDGSIEVELEMVRCEAQIRGELLMPGGAIVGGHIWAREGITVRVAGCRSGTDTTVGVGAPPWFCQRRVDRARLLAAHSKQAKALRDKLAPLMSNINRLSAAQREQVTQLLCHCEQLEEFVRVSASEGRTEESIFEPARPATIKVDQILHAGTRIRLGMLEGIVIARIDGPITIQERVSGHTRSIVYRRPGEDEYTTVPSNTVPADQLRREGGTMLPPLQEFNADDVS